MTRHFHFALFLLAVLLAVVAIHAYLWARLVRDAELPPPWRRIGTVALILLGAGLPLGMVAARAAPFHVGRWLSLLPFAWMGCMTFVLLFLLGADLVKIAIAGITRLAGGGSTADPARRVALSRIVAGAAGLAATGLGGVAVARAVGEIEIERVEVFLDRLPRAFDGFRIAQLSDLHIGLTLGRSWVERVVEKTLETDADMVAITGDLLDGTPDRLRDEVAPLVGLDAPHGVFFVTGNHEYYSGAPEWMPVLERLGMRVLRNERVRIERAGASFDLAGIDDHNGSGMAPGHGPDIGRALDGRDPASEAVLLAHQPRAVYEAAERDVGLVLCGHTHGGQIWPLNHLVRLQQPYVKGLHRHGRTRTQVWVSQGTGFWGPPMRLGTRCEISEITLRSGS